MGFFEKMNERAKKFGLLEIKLAQAAAMFFALICSKTRTANNGHEHMVVCSTVGDMCNKTVLRLFH